MLILQKSTYDRVTHLKYTKNHKPPLTFNYMQMYIYIYVILQSSRLILSNLIGIYTIPLEINSVTIKGGGKRFMSYAKVGIN